MPEPAPGEPGRRGLACLPDGARTAAPGDNCVLADSGIRRDDVDSAQGLRGFAAGARHGLPPRRARTAGEGRTRRMGR
ncbi:hypothetical protein [Streptomyces sp. RB17]|uniref:hypothetical protein n=1 Tax=Streptomyces sp. RB17 TaxID=2585197 RepID=UPI001298128B|nr:hypothetical protein [Streptomyces sp. RB17]